MTLKTRNNQERALSLSYPLSLTLSLSRRLPSSCPSVVPGPGARRPHCVSNGTWLWNASGTSLAVRPKISPLPTQSVSQSLAHSPTCLLMTGTARSSPRTETKQKNGSLDGFKKMRWAADSKGEGKADKSRRQQRSAGRPGADKYSSCDAALQRTASCVSPSQQDGGLQLARVRLVEAQACG